MNRFAPIATALAAALLAGAMPVKAEDPVFDVNLKLRAGVQVASTQDHLGMGLLGFGLEAGYATSPQDRWLVEAGYLYKAGTQYLLDVTGQPAAAGQTPDPTASVDSRKNQVQGITLRLAYERKLDGFSVKGGIMAARLQFRQEYIADVSGPGGNYEDTYNGVLTHSAFNANPFLGVTVPTLPGQTLEVTVLALGYTAVNYVHVAGVTVANPKASMTSLDSVSTSKRVIPHLEVAYGFQF